MSDLIRDNEEIRPPVTKVGVLGWLRENLFNGWFNSLLTLATLYLLWLTIPPLVKWAFIESHWYTDPGVCREGGGACWSIIPKNVRFIFFGFFPEDQQWRPALTMILLVGLAFYSKDRRRWKKSLAVIWLVGILLMGWLMHGGLGLPVVETGKWSGLPLTLLLSFFGMVFAYPLGVLLALGRRSKLAAIKSMCVVYIELIRGVPLISLLFMSSVMFPLFLPEGVTFDKVLRAQVAIILFTAAYIAEVVRGGLQAIPKGQYEAADSLGLNYGKTMRLIILPQALKIVIPPTVGILISAFKDTSLVVIIALYDVLKTTKVTLSNPEWMGFSTEAYLFLAALYFVCCYAMSSYSRRLEKELNTGR
ncbi:amino acid ABC transporter membrane protein 2 (PAAT family) [Geothermobacter ehrlichii]|uniref:Amino acid ABC transporter membrane protein 2 (PAAT family) n=1 Tax=Geothermobacter ehrlichii TaxID=213224 RepID=A0A5D3WLN8_9BACT|nr:amino acid ABC transporter permease [Geothermobacter ehrlichii]TYO99054.1 amino acid ABC transporter membrane protein 2 (PAAT family) [Geothermobacter ehrlichii]